MESSIKSAVTPRLVCVLLISIFIMFESYRLVDVLNGVWVLSVEVNAILKILLAFSALPFFMKFASKK
ncbi:hypothetical protein [Vibrio anguillarum]|uniref:Uncharacterized protein n=1 Tax=Vibrio anguillarum TaxID=55601 RepID=A0AAW4BI16_VIBAN|nr:hypothetical protein [Vibrio anguillarum]MBF4342563.1 hypothetical protein [Vibrio anguillarum]MBF4374971.1 hypothetical protein [Vibrio anguillarum]MBF4437690.1 hypothetical protein [Vibrio anguillarum]